MNGMIYEWNGLRMGWTMNGMDYECIQQCIELINDDVYHKMNLYFYHL
jgi:hypothetical protein